VGALERIGNLIRETVEERTGREIVPRERLDILESAEGQNRVLRKTLDFIGFTLFNYGGAQPSPYRMPNDMLPQARIFAAAQSLRAWIDDPMAGQQVDLYVSFVFGRGVPKPQAHDDEVQDVLDKTWADEANRRILTSYERLVEKGIDAAIQSNIYFTFFDDGEDGAVRISLLMFEDVLDVVRHPKDRFRILFYKVLEKQVVYDFNRGGYVTPPGDAGKPKTVYYEAYGAFDEDNAVMVAQDDAAGGKDAISPPSSQLRPGKVVHLAFNKTSEMAFGVPRMRRLLRWWTAYNEVLESHVNRMKAMASVYMKATVRGDQGQLDKLAMMATGRSSAFGATQDVPGSHHRPPGPAGPGILGQNESLNYEPFKIDSGAGDVAQSVPQLRAQVSGMFPPTYYGQDAGSLAGQQTVELPVLKFIERDQEAWAGPFRALGKVAIDAALRVGDLSEFRDATPEEQDEIAAAEESGAPLRFELNDQGQIKRDLGFELSLPSPLKRAMADLVAAAVQTATAVDPNATNPELSRWLFGFILAEAFDVEDPQRIVDQVLPRHLAVAAAEGEVQIDPATGRPVPPAEAPTSTGPDGKQHPASNPYGAKVNSPQPEERNVEEAAVDRGRRRAAAHASRIRRRDIGEAFDEQVGSMARDQLRRLGDVPALASTNGHASGVV